MRGWWSHVGGSEVSVSLSLHGSLHLLHHPQRNWERLQLVHPDVRTVPEHTQSSVTMATTDRHPCGDRGGDIVLTYIHHCETDPECPPRSAGRPDQTHTHTHRCHMVHLGAIISGVYDTVLLSPSSLLSLSCDVSLPTTAYPSHLLHTDTHTHTHTHVHVSLLI